MTHKLYIRWFWLAVPLFVFFLLFGSSFEPMRLNWGDPWSDGNAMTTGRYFKNAGFINTRFTPIIDVGDFGPESLKYTHYPPLPDILNGVLQKIGFNELWQFRWVAICFSMFGVLGLFLLASELYGFFVGAISVILCVTTLIWYQYADCIHHVPLFICFLNASLLFAVKWLKYEKQSALLPFSIFVFLAFLSSYDVWFFLPVSILLLVLSIKKNRYDPAALKLFKSFAFSMALALVVKFGLVIWAYHGFAHFYEDFQFQAEERGVLQLADAFDRKNFLIALFLRTLRFFGPIFYIVACFQIICFFLNKRILTPLLFLMAGLPFIFFFPQLVVEQFHPMLQFLPFYSIGIAFTLGWLWNGASSNFLLLRRSIVVIVIAFNVFWQVRERNALEKSFINAEDFKKIETLKEFDPDTKIMYTDFFVDSVFRYYLNKIITGVGGNSEEKTFSSLAYNLQRIGKKSILFIRDRRPELTYYDKVMHHGLLEIGEVSYPRPNKNSIIKRQVEKSIKLRDQIASVSELKMQTPEFEVFNIEIDKIQKKLNQLLTTYKETKSINSNELFPYIVSGNWVDEKGNWLVGMMQLQKYQLTLHGLKITPIHEYLKLPILLRIALSSAHNYDATLMLEPKVSHQNISIYVNGHLVRKFNFDDTTGLRVLNYQIPKKVLNKELTQLIELKFDKEDSQHQSAKMIGLNFKQIQ